MGTCVCVCVCVRTVAPLCACDACNERLNRSMERLRPATSTTAAATAGFRVSSCTGNEREHRLDVQN